MSASLRMVIEALRTPTNDVPTSKPFSGLSKLSSSSTLGLAKWPLYLPQLGVGNPHNLRFVGT